MHDAQQQCDGTSTIFVLPYPTDGTPQRTAPDAHVAPPTRGQTVLPKVLKQLAGICRYLRVFRRRGVVNVRTSMAVCVGVATLLVRDYILVS